jgi:hypothetical protein
MIRMSNGRRNALMVGCCAAALAASSAQSFAQTTFPKLGLAIGIRETNNPLGTTIGSTNALNTSAGIEFVGLNAKSITTDGIYTDVTFQFGTDPVNAYTGTGANGVLLGDMGTLEHLRVTNTDSIGNPINLFVKSIINTPNGGSPVTITDFQTTPTAFAAGATNVAFRDPSISGESAVRVGMGRNAPNNTLTTTQPDGTVDPLTQAARIQWRFSTPEPTWWGRLITSSTNTTGPVSPVIDIRSGSTLTLRLAATVVTPTWGWKGGASTATTTNWTDAANWGSTVPNGNTTLALFNEAAPAEGGLPARAVTVDSAISLNNLQITSPLPHTFSTTTGGTIRLTRQGSTATSQQPTLSVEAGSHLIDVPVTFGNNNPAITGTATVPYTPTIWVSSGASVTLNQPTTVESVATTATGTASAVLEKRGPGTANLAGGFSNNISVLRNFANGGTVRIGGTVDRTVSIATLNGSGSLYLDPSAGTTTVNTLTVTGAGNKLGSNVTGTGVAATGSISLAATSSLRLDVTGKGAIRATSFITQVSGGSTAAPYTAPTATLDLGDDGFILDYLPTETPGTSFGNVAALVTAGRNGGAWNGLGITSSLLPANSSAAIGYAEASTLGITSFMGVTLPDTSAIVVRYTLAGDATLDGTVNFDDLLKLAANYNNASGMSWTQGDANYDGAVNFDDLLKLAANYNQTVTGSFAGDWALAQAAVPEPTSLLAVAGAGLAVLSRRRRK